LSISRSMNVAVAFLCLSSVLGIVQGLWALFFPRQALGAVASMLSETLESPMIVHYCLCQLFGVFSTLGFVLFVVISVIPYRKGKKWAWYTLLVVGLLTIIAGVVLFVRDISDSTALINAFYTLVWQAVAFVIGLAIPAKEILGKH